MTDNKNLSYPYFWHEAEWLRLVSAHEQGRLPHGLLLEGPVGLGKSDFALALAAYLLDLTDESISPDTLPTALAAHPDFTLITPEEGKYISIEQIRKLKDGLSLHSYRGGLKCASLVPAERMTIAAANSLLKTLEEPGAGTVLLLVAERSSGLPATVVSRCQRVCFRPPPADLALAWLDAHTHRKDWTLLLEFAGGAPLGALAIATQEKPGWLSGLHDGIAGVIEGRRDPLEIASEWAEESPELCLRWLHAWVADLIRYRTAGHTRVEEHKVLIGRLQTPLGNISLQSLFGYLDRLSEMVPAIRGQANRQLALETLLIPWSRALRV